MPMTPTHHQGAASPLGALGGPARHQSLEGGLGRWGLPQRGICQTPVPEAANATTSQAADFHILL